jgi:hypothetical protein
MPDYNRLYMIEFSPLNGGSIGDLINFNIHKDQGAAQSLTDLEKAKLLVNPHDFAGRPDDYQEALDNAVKLVGLESATATFDAAQTQATHADAVGKKADEIVAAHDRWDHATMNRGDALRQAEKEVEREQRETEDMAQAYH